MPICDRCGKVITGKKLYSDPIVIGKIDCKSCYNLACDEIGRIDLIEK